MCKQTLCPQCIGAKEIMIAKTESKGFKYLTCSLCEGTGYVNLELAEDFELSLNEDNFTDDD